MLAAIGFWQFCNEYGNAASVVGFVLTFAGFIVTWIRQRTIRRVTENTQRQMAEALGKIALQILAGDVEQAIRYIGEARTSGQDGRWLRAFDKFYEARLVLMRLVGNQQLKLNEVAGVQFALQNLVVVGRMIETEKRDRGATPRFPEQSINKLDEVVGTLGGNPKPFGELGLGEPACQLTKNFERSSVDCSTRPETAQSNGRTRPMKTPLWSN